MMLVFNAEKNYTTARVDIFAFNHEKGRYISRIKQAIVEFEEIDQTKSQHGHYSAPISLEFYEAQTLMDALYRAGIRPTDIGGIGQVHAMETTIESLREINKQLLNILSIRGGQ
jgi:hypothetical protein